MKKDRKTLLQEAASLDAKVRALREDLDKLSAADDDPSPPDLGIATFVPTGASEPPLKEDLKPLPSAGVPKVQDGLITELVREDPKPLPNAGVPKVRDELIAELVRAQGERTRLEETLKTEAIPRLVTKPGKTPLPGVSKTLPLPPGIESTKVPRQPPRPAVRRPLAEGLAALDPAVPLVLLPVRLEVRFALDERALLLRIYPDEIFADSHEPALTATERTLGARFWSVARDASLGPRAAWRELLQSLRPERAAWVVRVTDPSGPVPVGDRASSWSRAVEAWLLPDSWQVRLVRYVRPGEPITPTDRSVSIGPVEHSLALTVAPPPPTSAPAAAAGEGTSDPPPPYDEGTKWTVDFNRACDVGMAHRIQIDAVDEIHGFDRIFVVGVYSDQSPGEGARALARLLDAQHYTRGLAFVRQGTPTNNTAGGPAGYPPSKDPDASFEVERTAPTVDAESDGARFARALGVDAAVFQHVAGQERHEQRNAADMNRLLWASTVGYFLTQMMARSPGDDELIEALQKHFIAHVRGRGALPALRVGSVPYGWLIASSIREWRPSQTRAIDRVLPGLIHKLHQTLATPFRLPDAGGAPRVGRTWNDPDLDLLEILGGDSRARDVRVRQAVGPEGALAILAEVLRSEEAVEQARQAMARAARPSSRPSLGLVDDLIFSLFAGRFAGPLVGRGVDGETPPAENQDARVYLQALARAELSGLRAGLRAFADNPPLLYALARHAGVWEFSAIGDRHATDGARNQEHERVGVRPELPTRTAHPAIWERLTATQPRETREAILAEFQPWRAAAERLAQAPQAELERLLTETLDVCSHRLDAWESSLFHERLAEMRASRPEGCHVGAWGVLEDVRRRPPLAAQTAGYIHAPSLDHAATAAVLLNAHHTYRGEQRERFRVDLSSRRVRGALAVLDAVRAGQRFEDAVTRAAGGDATRAQEVRDALGDLFTAESVFQIIRGNASTAAAALDALSRGQRPPDPEVVRSPRGGASVTHRVLLAIPTGRSSSAGWRLSLTPRARLSPALDAWVGDMLGNPSRVQCLVKYTSPTGERVTQPLSLAALDLRPLDVLAMAVQRPPGFTPGQASPPDTFSTELEIRLARALPPRSSEITIDFHAGTGLGFPALFEVARAVNALFGTARSLRETDLRLPDRGSPAPSAALTTDQDGELSGVLREFDDLCRDLSDESIRTADRDALNEVLLEATLFDIPEALLTNLEPSDDEIRAAATRTSRVLRERLVRAAWPTQTAATEPASTATPTPDLRVAYADASSRSARDPDAVVEALFGRRRLRLTKFAPLPVREPHEGGHDPDRALALPVPRGQLREWLQSMWRVRGPLETWRRVALYEGALGTTRTEGTVLQLEPAPYGMWAGTTLRQAQGEFVLPPSGCVSLVRLSPYGPIADAWAGLLLDEWTEMIPNQRELTGIAFHYDDPGAEAPQAVLVAVPPRPGEPWTEQSLFAVLEDTLELAQVRTLDASALGELGRIVPALYLAMNGAGDTVSTTFSNLQSDPVPASSGASS